MVRNGVVPKSKQGNVILER